MGTEKIVRSVRANPEIFEKLNAISKEKGLDQSATLEALINAWDVQAAKGLVPERAADVADFDAHLQGIQKAFLRSLDLVSGAEARARNAYAAQLDAMNNEIARLKQDLGNARAKLCVTEEELEEARGKIKRLEEGENIKEMKALLETVAARLGNDLTEPDTDRDIDGFPTIGAPLTATATRRKRGAKVTAEEKTVQFPAEKEPEALQS